MVDEITLGSLTFIYDDPGLEVRMGDEPIARVRCRRDEWDDFHAAAAMGATVITAMTPTEKPAGESPGDARAVAALGRAEQTMEMLAALQFQITVLVMSLGAVLGRPEHHDVIRKDAKDVEDQARELRKFVSRLLYVRAREG